MQRIKTSISVSHPVPGSIWQQLPYELVERVGSCLSHNDIACSFRLVNKTAAEQFRGPLHTKVLLSQPTPAHAFAWRWGDPGATRALTYKQRIQLLCLTAASGSIPNMEVALASAGCLPTKEVFSAAAVAGQLHMCEWLLEQDCPCDGALGAAAQAGQRDVCTWLIERVERGRICGQPESAYRFAARGGHMGLTEELMRLHQAHPLAALRPPQSRLDCARLVTCVAEGCDLATLERLHHTWLEAPANGAQQQQPAAAMDRLKASIVAAAAASPSPDWRAKVEWLEGRGYHCTYHTATAAAGRPDAVERLRWLSQRGCQLFGTAEAAARAGNLEALQYLHSQGVLLTAGTVETAAENGHLGAVAWLVETLLGTEEYIDRWGLFKAAASSGSVELLAWLRGRFYRWGEETFTQAARAGNGEALEWLVEQGCPVAADGSPYTTACERNDVATLHCLVRLGCPWGPVGQVFTTVALMYDPRNASGVALSTLRVLLSAGCPMDWEAAEAGARSPALWAGLADDVLSLLADERERRQGLGQEEQ